jgi:hypothetical protein
VWNVVAPANSSCAGFRTPLPLRKAVFLHRN